MDKKYLQEKIKIAKDLVSDVEDTYKTAAFGVVLTNLLNSNVNKSETLKKTIEGKKDLDDNLEINYVKNMGDLASKCNLSPEELSDVITIKNGEVEIIAPVQGKEAEQQVIVAQCVLIVHEAIFKNDWVKTSVMKECLRKSGILDKGNNLAKYLKNKPTIFRMRGSKNGTEYKLTTPGRISSFQTIQSLAKGK